MRSCASLERAQRGSRLKEASSAGYGGKMEESRASGSTTALYATLAIAAALVLLLPLSAPLQRRFLASHQLRPPSTASWIAVGLLPKMYGGAQPDGDRTPAKQTVVNVCGVLAIGH